MANRTPPSRVVGLAVTMIAKSRKKGSGMKERVRRPTLASGPKLYAGKPSNPVMKETYGGRGTPMSSVRSSWLLDPRSEKRRYKKNILI